MRAPLRRPWSNVDVVVSLLSGATRVVDKLRVGAYLLGRRNDRIRRLTRHWVNSAPISLGGLSSPLHISDATGGLATYYEIVCQRIYGASEAFQPQLGDTVLDVGANIGVFSVWAAGRVGSSGRIVSIEPHPEAFGALCRNVEATPCVTPLQVACADRDGRLKLRFVPGRLSVSSAEPRADRTGSVEVPVFRLDTLSERHELGPVDFLKVDVEGLELEVLHGARRVLDGVDRLAMEVDSRKLPEVDELLRGHGLCRAGQMEAMWGIANARMVYWQRASRTDSPGLSPLPSGPRPGRPRS